MKIRSAQPSDAQQWAAMRDLLWPDSREAHLADIARFWAGQSAGMVEVFVIDRQQEGQLGGFLELNVRHYAEGSDNDRVPYVEGWFVAADCRGRGWGRKLIEAAEQWAIVHGYNELASDAEMENHGSIAAHKALGFAEVDRVVCFLKPLKQIKEG